MNIANGIWVPPSGGDAHWVAGIYEGEGSPCWGHHWKSRSPSGLYGWPVLDLKMTDLDVMQRASRLMCGHLHTRVRKERRKDGTLCKPYHKLAFGCEGAVVRMLWLRPFMGERRRAQIDRCIELWEARPLKRVCGMARMSRALANATRRTA